VNNNIISEINNNFTNDYYKSINKQLARGLLSSKTPYSWLDDEEMKKFLNMLDPNYKIPMIEELVDKLLNIEFEEFNGIAKNDQEKRLKGKVFEYFLYELAIHNGMIVEMNQTFISFSKRIFKTLSDGCTDLH
ncbi:7891_t:CDS:2, partial [Cetraspora pellucida]